MKKRNFCTFFLLLSLTASVAVDFSSMNTNYWYEVNRGIEMNFRVIRENTQSVVFLEMRDIVNARGTFHYYLQEGYAQEDHQVLNGAQIDTLRIVGNSIIYAIRFDPGDNDLFIVHYEFAERNVNFYYPIPLKRGKLDAVTFYPADTNRLPLVRRYVKRGVDFIVPEEDSLFFFQYNENFNPADPPMGSVQAVSPSLSIDSVFQTSNSSLLTPGHFYFIQRDTLSTEGLTVYMAQDHYPNYRKLDELVLPLTYFTRRSEMTRIMEASDPKVEFDRFWITTFGSKERARAAIRTYYRRVANANRLFTDYKQGWKTDRGLLYVMFGEPLEVYRDNRTEIWKYSDVEFEFRIISNLFAPELYVLMRNKDYEQAWNMRVQLMRGRQ